MDDPDDMTYMGRILDIMEGVPIHGGELGLDYVELIRRRNYYTTVMPN